MSRKCFGIATAAAVALAVGMSAEQAKAGLVLEVGNQVFTDNAIGDADPATGRIVASLSGPSSFLYSVNISTSNNPGTVHGGILDITSITAHNFGPTQATLTIKVRDDSFTTPGTARADMKGVSRFGGSLNGLGWTDSVSFQSFADPDNVSPAAAVPTSPLTFQRTLPAGGSEAFSGSNEAYFTRDGSLYSLANVLTITLSSGASVNVSGTTTAYEVPDSLIVPLPGAALAGLVGLASLGVTRLRRRMD